MAAEIEAPALAPGEILRVRPRGGYERGYLELDDVPLCRDWLREAGAQGGD